MLEDALTDRDLVHRQTASTIVKHLALGVVGLGCEDSMMHLMNLVWPNCFETSPHVIGAVIDAIEAMRVTLGPGVLLSYVLQGLFHPARKVCEVYWHVYNALYLGAADALVPFYPDLGSSVKGRTYMIDTRCKFSSDLVLLYSFFIVVSWLLIHEVTS
jgi:splicing factor 3B subunit 1